MHDEAMNPALKVLVVEDNEMTRSHIIEIVKHQTNEILECSSGMDALGEYSINRPDWVLMDANMQTMDGLTATSLIHQYFPKAKVMIVSADKTQKMKDAAHQVGASAFVARDNLFDILSHLKL